MGKRTTIFTREDLMSAPLPDQTETYTVISHSAIINTVMKNLDEKGFQMNTEHYKANENAEIACGIYRLAYGNDPELSMMLAFSNSYDKSMRFKCAIGAHVKINDMSIIADTVHTWKRKHTGTADSEMEETINTLLDDSKKYFDQLVADKDKMKKIKLTKKEFAHLIGELYIDKRLLSSEQISVVRNEYMKPSFPYKTDSQTLWTLYNHILIALAKSHPRTWMDQQRLVHLHIMEAFTLAEFDSEPEVVEEQSIIEASVEETPNPIVVPAEQLEVQKEVKQPVTVIPKEFHGEAEKEVVGVEALKITPTPVAEKHLGGGNSINEKADTTIVVLRENPVTIAEAVKPKGFALPQAPKYTAPVETVKEEPVVKQAEPEKISEDFELKAEESPTTTPVAVEELKKGYELANTSIDSKDHTIDPQQPIFMSAENLLEILDVVREGDRFILNDEFYEIMHYVEENDIPGFMIKQVGSLGEKLEVTPEPVVETVPEVKSEPVINPEANEVSQEDLEAAAEKFDQIVVESDIAKNNTAMQTKVDDEIRQIISAELFELYGSIQQFEYTIKDTQYNVKLATGETVVLLKSEIDSRLNV